MAGFALITFSWDETGKKWVLEKQKANIFLSWKGANNVGFDEASNVEHLIFINDIQLTDSWATKTIRH